MSYNTLYRKFRPRTFDEIIGQKEIVSLLKNQIRTKSFSHAYIFSGIRGTGKTSSAKIFSRAVNCLAPVDGNPCNECDHCKGILSETILDVIEMDAASNNGIDNIRDIKENIKFLPSVCDYKVYIIDEAHMLSNSAFNALLKTLEEPPGHVIFILATTEFNKLPVTIQSRCLKLEFSRISHSEIEQHLSGILDSIGFTYDKRIIELVAKKSEGSSRDSLSILEKLVSSAQNGHIGYEESLPMLGSLDYSSMAQILTRALQQDSPWVVSYVERLLQSGFNVSDVLENMQYFIRDVLMINILGEDNELIDLPAEMKNELRNSFSELGFAFFDRMNKDLNSRMLSLKTSSFPRLELELFLLNIPSHLEQDASEAPARKVFPKQASQEAKTEETKDIQQKQPEQETKEYIPVKQVSEAMELKKAWDMFMSSVKSQSMRLYATLIEGNLAELSENVFRVEMKDDYVFHLETLSSYDNKILFEKLLQETFGRKLSFQIGAVGEKFDKKSEVNQEKEFTDFFEGFEDKMTIK